MTNVSKAADSRFAAATGEGPNKILPLNEHEKCLLAIIGPVAIHIDKETSEPLAADPVSSRPVMPAPDESAIEPMQEERLNNLRPAQDDSIPEDTLQQGYEIERCLVAAKEKQAATTERLATAVNVLASSMEGLAAVMEGLQEQMGRQAAATEALVEIVRAMKQK